MLCKHLLTSGVKGSDSPEKTCKTHERELDLLTGDELPRVNVGCVFLQRCKDE